MAEMQGSFHAEYTCLCSTKGQGEGRRKTEAHLGGSRREVGKGHEGGLLLTSYLLEYSDDWQTERCYMNAPVQ